VLESIKKRWAEGSPLFYITRSLEKETGGSKAKPGDIFVSQHVMEKELAKQKVEVTGKRLRKAFRALQKAHAVFERDQSDLRAFEVYTAAWNEHTVANTAEMAAMTASNELYLHSVTEAGTQTDSTGITGS
jgi:hypothetical protein